MMINTRILQSLICCLLLIISPVFGADALQEVMHALSKVERSEVNYHEEKHIDLLDFPLEQTGHLIYIAPDQFSRSLDSPGGERFLVHGDQVTLEKKNRKKTRDLNSLPMVKAFIASFGATLAGDLPRLQQYYKVSFSGGKSNWQLRLQPKDSKLSSYVTEIILSGNFDKISSVETYKTNGDWERMILLHD